MGPCMKRVLVAFFGSAGAARAAVVCPSSPDQFEHDVGAAFDEYMSVDYTPATYQTLIGRVREEVTCLDAPVTPALAASYHRLEALDALAANDEARALASLRAAHDTGESCRYQHGVLPPDHALNRLCGTAEQAPRTKPVDIEQCRAKTYWVDGAKLKTLSPDHPSIVQRGSRRGTIHWSALVPAGHTPTSCGTEVVALGMSVGTAAAGVAAASLWTVALLERQQTLQLGEELGAGVTTYPGGEFNECSVHLASGDSAGRDRWAACAGDGYRADHVDPTNNLGYAAQAATGAMLAFGVSAIVLTVRW